jgi:citrate synthase
MLWLLLTGQVPTSEQIRQLSRELAEKGDLPKFVEQLVDECVSFLVRLLCPVLIGLARLPKTLHPMTQLGIGVAALNHDSAFQAAYEKGMKKTEYWAPTLEDCLNLIARLPALAARIYRNVYKPGTELPAINKDLDLVGTCL